MTEYLKQHGYHDYSGQIGRNICELMHCTVLFCSIMMYVIESVYLLYYVLYIVNVVVYIQCNVCYVCTYVCNINPLLPSYISYYTPKIGYIRDDFVPSARPGLAADCYNGARKSDHAERWWANRRTPPFQACSMTALA